jgi:HSP20 family protein
MSFKEKIKIKKNEETSEQGDFSGFLSDAGSRWLPGEAQLSCDVWEDKDSIVIKSTVAGVKPEDLEIAISNDLLTIRGSRQQEETVEEEKYFSRECYWGSFSRSIVLPREVNQKKIEATIKNGILTIRLPKKYKTSEIKVRQLDED